MTNSLFVVEDVGGGHVHYSTRDRDELLGEWIPGTAVVEYVPLQRWIPVGERLPEEMTLVLVSLTAQGPVITGYVDADGCWRDGESCLMSQPPTHWMPLPEGPDSHG